MSSEKGRYRKPVTQKALHARILAGKKRGVKVPEGVTLCNPDRRFIEVLQAQERGKRAGQQRTKIKER